MGRLAMTRQHGAAGNEATGNVTQISGDMADGVVMFIAAVKDGAELLLLLMSLAVAVAVVGRCSCSGRLLQLLWSSLFMLTKVLLLFVSG